MTRTVAQVIVDGLADLGVGHVFGVVGDALNPITDAIRTTEGIDWTGFRHEEAAAFAAGARAQLSGDLAVCMGTVGPGSVHLFNGLYDAAKSGAPVLAICGQVPLSELGGERSRRTCRRSGRVGPSPVGPVQRRRRGLREPGHKSPERRDTLARHDPRPPCRERACGRVGPAPGKGAGPRHAAGRCTDPTEAAAPRPGVVPDRSVAASSGRMAGLEVAQFPVPKKGRRPLGPGTRRDGPQEEAHVVAALDASLDPAGEPGWSRCTVRRSARSATRYAWSAVDSRTVNLGGSMEHCEAKPTRQPARSPPEASAVATYIGPSRTSVKESSPITTPPLHFRGFTDGDRGLRSPRPR
ncbi:hypothetical protein STANM337S_07151 [Streptomyces tanashiensis]